MLKDLWHFNPYLHCQYRTGEMRTCSTKLKVVTYVILRFVVSCLAQAFTRTQSFAIEGRRPRPKGQRDGKRGKRRIIMQPETLWTRVQAACSARQVEGRSSSLDEARVQPAVQRDEGPACSAEGRGPSLSDEGPTYRADGQGSSLPGRGARVQPAVR